MLDALWLVVAAPLAGFVILALFGGRLPRGGIAVVGVGSVAFSAALASVVGMRFVFSPPENHVYTQTLWTWMDLGQFAPKVTLYLDALSLVMVLVVTVVGFLIHLYSAEYMMEDEDYSRFFAYMNLFVAAMLTLVLADNLVVLYIGWEGVGLCSFLLIGFWYREPENVRAAIKAFIMTRIGDVGLIIGLFLLFNTLGTLQIREVMNQASQNWAVGSTIAVAAAALILTGALGKSAQLPLQAWLPDAMAGPTPVSALIHAATMVTAGVYLIARMNVLFSLAPVVQHAVAIIGVVTLLLAGFSALTQSDIKRVLAYSTISQIGYMFLGLGVGAWSAAMFHFMTHAFFKSLLFLAAGSIILAAGHEQNMFKLGGIRKRLPLTFWTFLVGSASLASVPLVTDGFYSKDMILFSAWASEKGSVWLWAGGMVGVLLTTLYTFRMIFLTCFGEARTPLTHRSGVIVGIPLIVLAILSVVVGFVELPSTMGNLHLFSDLLKTALPPLDTRHADSATELILQIVSGVTCLLGIAGAYFFFLRYRDRFERIAALPLIETVHHFWLSGWGFDWLYDRIVVRPFLRVTHVNRNDFIDSFYSLVAWITEMSHMGLSATQTGYVRGYAFGIGVGVVVTLGILALL
jgi:NADH-quinone oxidoreductase subunit L